jgi:ABC-type Fe3+-hydroxamate transport system substrate-binding protein
VLRDAAGVAHAPADTSARIVSLVPSITELLFDLGLESQIVGRTRFCIHPKDKVGVVRRVGGTKHVSLSKISELCPTHTIVNVDENAKAEVEAIAEFVAHIIVTHPVQPQDNLELYQLLGGIFGKPKQAAQLSAAFRQAYQDLLGAAKTWPVKRVLYLIWRSPWMTVSSSTYISNLLSVVNWQTVGGEVSIRYPEIELTQDLLQGVDIILFSSEPYPFSQAHIDAFQSEYPGSRQLLSLIDGEMLSWYGSRAIKGLRYLRSFVPVLLRQSRESWC